jgi:Plavaka transposase
LLIEVIKSAFQDPTANFFHYTPFKLFWKPSPDQPSQRIISELYNSEAMITEHKNIQKQPVKEGCTLERSIAAIMLWSDATHLANFGTASLRPIYLFFGNQSKYT